ncbi:hypothetical protein [Phytohabitans rumicis]|uniref:hypothetical protein n=1 Tax=Phytohabitans rumicis TaxID=1076125 RepID=UPI001FE3903D|nr:hypothetical protein [Phytohabitans rumicis]
MRTRDASFVRSVRWQVGKARISGPPTRRRRREQPDREQPDLVPPMPAPQPVLAEPDSPAAPAPPAPPPAPGPPPPKWKLAIVTLSAVFPPVLLFNVTLIPFLRGFSVVARSAALCVAVTAVTTYVLMPRLQKWFRTFLYPLAGRQRAVRPGGVPPSTRRRARRSARRPAASRGPLATPASQRRTAAPCSGESVNEDPPARQLRLVHVQPVPAHRRGERRATDGAAQRRPALGRP